MGLAALNLIDDRQQVAKGPGTLIQQQALDRLLRSGSLAYFGILFGPSFRSLSSFLVQITEAAR
jgi:hypothetical protein